MLHLGEHLKRKLESEANEKKEKAGFWITDLTRCPRGVFLQRKGERGEVDDRLARVFKCGNLFEDFVVSTIPKESIIELQGRVVWPEFDLSGRFDLLMQEDNGVVTIREIKSQHSASFHWMRKRGGANPHHIQQVLMYASQLKDKYPNLQAVVDYVSKDDLCIEEYVIPYDQKVVDEALLTAKMLKEHWDADTLPPAAPNIVEDAVTGPALNWVAKYCDIHDKCTGNPNWLAETEEIIQTINPKKKRFAK